MPDAASEHKPNARTAAPASKPTTPKSNGATLTLPILAVTSSKAGVAHVTLSAKRYSTVTVGMTGVLLGVDAKVEITAVSPGIAKAVIRGAGIEKMWIRRYMVVLDPNPGLLRQHEAMSAPKEGSGSSAGIGGSPR